MNIKIVGTEPDKTDLERLQDEVDESIPQQTVESSEPGELDVVAARQALDLRNDDRTYDDELKTLVKWAKTKVDSDDPTHLKWAIRDLGMRIGTPAFGDAIKNLARFAYLDLEEKRIKSEKAKFI